VPKDKHIQLPIKIVFGILLNFGCIETQILRKKYMYMMTFRSSDQFISYQFCL